MFLCIDFGCIYCDYGGVDMRMCWVIMNLWYIG